MEGSDLHLKVPSQPLIRLHGRLEPIPGSDPLTPEDTELVLLDLIGKDKHKLEEFTDENEVGVSSVLVIEATIGPFFSVSARAFSQSGSAPNAPNFCSRSASDSHFRK